MSTRAKNKQYVFIRLWGALMGSYDYYVQDEIQRARETDAPEDAIYERSGIGGVRTGEWARFSEIENESTKRQLREIAERRGYDISAYDDEAA